MVAAMPPGLADPVQVALARAVGQIPRAGALPGGELRTTFERPPFSCQENSAIVPTLLTALEKETGKPPFRRGEAFWTDCAAGGDRGSVMVTCRTPRSDARRLPILRAAVGAWVGCAYRGPGLLVSM